MKLAEYYSLEPKQQWVIMEQAAKQSLKLWGFDDGQLELIKVRENAVYKLTHNEQVYALRVHRMGYHTDNELQSEIQWMKALNEEDVATPSFIESSDKKLFELVRIADLENPFQIDIQNFVNAKPLGSIEDGVGDDEEAIKKTFNQVGVIAAKTHNHAEHWQRPEGFVRHAWDVDGLTGENPYWGRFWEFKELSPEQVELLTKAREKLQEELIDYGTSVDRYGLVHADFLPENFLVGDDGVVRLIDFDDAGFGWHMFDIATSLAFHVGEPHFELIRDSLIEGYRTERELSEEQLNMLPTMLFARMTTYVGWLHTRGEVEGYDELMPVIVGGACALAEDYLQG